MVVTVTPSGSGHGFEIGDMVWVKMKSPPWLPGHVYSEEFATPLVRKSKREGLLLVALFGASSYGWFDSSELIPFDLSYLELSVQTDSRMFVRAVEDAMVEVNRRIGLGLSCMCGNNQNFRKTDVQGFVVVDVAGYDRGAVYSIAEIGKARDGFQPKLAVDFLRQLALEPASSEHVDDIDFIKNKATVLSYRKAVYEDFGYQASIQEPAPQETSSKAPLSGKEVSAGSVGIVNNTTKVKDHAKKDKYLFKRRDDKEIKKEKEKVASSLLPVSFEDSTSASVEFAFKYATGCLEDTPPTALDFSNPCFERSTGIAESPTSSVAEVDQAEVKFADDETGIVQEVEDRKVITQDDFPSPGPDKTASFQTVPEKVKIPKRPVGKLGSGEIITSENKRKPKKEGIYLGEKFSAKRTGHPEDPQRSDGNCETDLSRVLGDLHSLAADPCNTTNRGSCIKGKKAFLMFRSLVFKKSKNFSLPLADGEPKAGPSVKPPSRFKPDVKQLVATELKKPGREPTMLILKFPQGGSLPSFNELKARFARYGPMDHSATQILRNTFSCQVVFRHKTHAQAAHRFVVESSSLFGNTDVKCSLKDVGDVDVAKPEPLRDESKDLKRDKEKVTSTLLVGESGSGKSIMPEKKKQKKDGISLVEKFSAKKAGQSEGPHRSDGNYETDLSRVLEDLHSFAVDPFNTVNGGSRIKGKKAFLRFRSLVFQKGQNFSLPLAGGEPNASKSSDDSVQLPPVKPPSGLKRGPSDRQEEIAAAKKKKTGDIRTSTKEKKVTKMIDEPPARDVKQPVATTLKKPRPELIKKTEQRAPRPTMVTLKFPQGGSLPSYNELKARFAHYGPMDHSATHIFWNTFSCQVLFKHKAHAQAAYRFVVGSSSLFGNTGVKCTLKEVEVGTTSSTKPEPPVKVPKQARHQPDMVPDTSGVQPKSILKKSSGEEAAGSGGRGRVKFMLGGEESKNSEKAGPSTTQPPPHSVLYGTTMLAPPVPPRSMQTTPLPLMTPNTDIEIQMLSLLTRCRDVVTNVSSILGYMPYHPL